MDYICNPLYIYFNNLLTQNVSSDAEQFFAELFPGISGNTFYLNLDI